MRASRDFPLGIVLVVVFANILTTYAGQTAFYFFNNVNRNGERMQFKFYPNGGPNCLNGELPVDWNLNWPTCLVIGDNFEDPTKKEATSVMIKEALLEKRRECNVVVVHWHSDAGFESSAVNLITVREALKTAFITKVPDVGYQVAQFITWIRRHLRRMLRRILMVTAFAQGMGAQVIGYAAQVLKAIKEPQIETIIATDPPSLIPDGGNSPTSAHYNYINKKSAFRVIIIKTNVGGLGSHHIDGHLIFYINNEYVGIKKDATDFGTIFRNVKFDNANNDVADNANMLNSLEWVQVQPGFMNQKKKKDKLLFSHRMGAKFLAEQIMNPTKVTVGKFGISWEMTLFEGGMDENLIPTVGLLIVLSWKKDGPTLVSEDYVAWADSSAKDLPQLNKAKKLDCKPVSLSPLQGRREECPAKAHFIPRFQHSTVIGSHVAIRVLTLLKG